ncbi:unnamed protein product [Caenorhabditis angaria]|uniref:Inosine/uridine-preferring nucleoside hydrolase domain-containing protein n=1 Tax=Caenorhabditis angaria TaxID=860376 RepID=A0A9P1I9U4_9PELO|nr:unnamed protein product [Caenorhabditis angaria]
MRLLTSILLIFSIFSLSLGAISTNKLIIDTDGAFDDIRALTIALSQNQQQIDILAITTTHGSVSAEQAARNVHRILIATQQTQIPVYIGANDSIIPKGPVEVWEELYGNDGLGGVPNVWPEAQLNISNFTGKIGGVDAIIAILKSHPKEVTLICIGPLTNLALAIQKDPSVVENLGKVIIMGGNYLGIGNTLTNSTAEFNFLMDPEAAAIVLQNIHATIIPWDTSFLKGPEYSKKVDYQESLRLDSPLSNFLSEITKKARKFNTEHGQTYSFIDDIAVAIGIEPKIAEKVQKLYANVELTNGTVTRGQVVIDWLSAAYNEKSGQFEAEEERNDHDWLAQEFVVEYDVQEINRLLMQAVSPTPIAQSLVQNSAKTSFKFFAVFLMIFPCLF